MHILLTTDLSPESAAAFEVARQYTQAFKADLTLLSVVEDPAQAAMMYALEFPVVVSSDIKDQMISRVRSELVEIQKKHLAGLQSKALVREGLAPVHIEVIRAAQELTADLIIIASHGRTGFKHLLIGSVAERVARESTCPVLVVPTKKS